MRRQSAFRTTWSLAVLALAALVALGAAMAAGTPAGTVISNTATVNFEDVNGNTLSQDSNTVTTTVATVATVDIAPPSLSANADPGDDVCYLHTVTNLGNTTDTIDVATASSEGWTVVVYLDVNGNGVYDAGTDTPLTDSNGNATPDTGPLPDNVTSPGNEAVEILVCVSVPAGTADGTVDTTTIDVASDNDPGQTDAATDTTTIDAPSLGVVKSVSPTGDQPPGTVLTYTVVITNNGSGVANNVVLSDPVPAFTTYQAGSITQDAAGRSDAADADNADFGATTANAVTVSVGTMASGASTTISFSVQID